MADPAERTARATRVDGRPSTAPVHRGHPAFTLGVEGGENLSARLAWGDTEGLARPVRLRVTIARELWGATDLVAFGRRGEIGRAVLDHVDAFEHVDVPLRPGEPDELAGGIRLHLDGPETVEVFGAGAGEGGFLGPRLLAAEARDTATIGTAAVDRLLDGIASPASLQAFGWKLGCVLDGLLDLAAAHRDDRFARRARAHLDEFMQDGVLAYHDPWGRPVRGAIYGIEGLLPLAALARLGDVEIARDACDGFLARFRRGDGALRDHGMLSTEGMYTVAYPLALIGSLAGREDYLADAALQLRVRVRELRDGGVLLRHYEDGRVEFRDWVRAWTWYLLGLARTLPFLGGIDVDDLRAEFDDVVAASLDLRAAGALWHTYVDEPGTPIETSGSAGIAAAWAIGAGASLLDPVWRDRARETADAALAHVGTEGLLGGASQANKGGERLQRSAYRINSQVGTGLLAQLLAALSGEDVAAPGVSTR